MRVYGEGGGVFFARNILYIAVSPVTAVNKAVLHLTLKLAALTHTHTHTHTHTNEIVYAWWNFFYLKYVHILENVVNICIINDLSYPQAPADITAIRASLLRRRYQQHHWVVKWGNLYVSIVWEGCFHTRSATGQPWIYSLDYSYNEVWAIQITGVLPEGECSKHKIRPVGFSFL